LPFLRIYLKLSFIGGKKDLYVNSKKLGKGLLSWALFILLSLIWGSSFVLMKIGLEVLTPYQVASLRMLSAAIVLLPFAWRAILTVEKKNIAYVLVAGLLGNFFPAYLYCIAETKIDSSLTAILNSLTPLFTIVAGIFFFRSKPEIRKIIGVLVGFLGLLLLPSAIGAGVNIKDISYALLVLIATICYAANVLLVSRSLNDTGALHITALSFFFLLIPSLIILIETGFFHLPLAEKSYLHSTVASLTLGIMGTAIATVLFYMLVKKGGALFSSMVTYGIPVVAVMWGVLYGENITTAEIGCLIIILAGVYIVSRNRAGDKS
jgi:drug/metabolite transporter (DMT)-like permease